MCAYKSVGQSLLYVTVCSPILQPIYSNVTGGKSLPTHRPAHFEGMQLHPQNYRVVYHLYTLRRRLFKQTRKNLLHNGCGSCDKSSLEKNFLSLFDDLYVHVG